MKKPAGSELIWTPDFIYLTASIFLVSTAFYILMPTLPVFLQEVLGAGKREVGLIVATYTLAALLVRPFTGYALDLWGRKAFYLISIAVFALLFALYPMATALVPILLLRFLHGINWGVSTTAGFTLVVDFVPLSRRGRGISYFGLAFTVAMSAGPLIGLEVMGQGRFNALFLTATGIAALGALIALLVRYPPFKRPDWGGFNWKYLIAARSVPVSLNILIMTATYGGVLTFSTLYARENGMESLTGWFFSSIAVATALTRLVSGQLFDRYGPTLISLAGILSIAAGLMLLGEAPIAGGFLLSGFLIGAGFGVVFPTFQTMANNVVHRDRRGTANATFLTGLDLGIGLGAFLTGAFADQIGLDRTFRVSALVALAGLLFFLLVSLPHYTRNRVDD
ncbi:MAG: MFS transporter [Bacteroidales bacterium]